MAKRLFVVVAALAFTGVSIFGQTKASIQGVWRPVEVTITNPTPAPGTFSKGVHTDVQPGLLIVTAKHYSTMNDTAAKPRPTVPFKDVNKPTLAEAQSQWGPFNANSGTYEVSGTTMTRHAIVAKNASIQGGKNFSRYTFKLEGNNLWLTQTETQDGKAQNAATVKYVRVVE